MAWEARLCRKRGMCHAGYLHTYDKRAGNGDISPRLRHYRYDFPQNTQLYSGNISDYSWDMGHNSVSAFLGIQF